VIVDDEKVKREENVPIITRGRDVGSYAPVTMNTLPGVAPGAGGEKVPRLLTPN
jgi:hypothetical protein